VKRAALYMRVSTLDQHPETQMYDLRGLAAQRDFQIVQEYTDRLSGAPLDIDRQAVLCDRDRHGSPHQPGTVSRVIKEAGEATSPKGCVPLPLQTDENRPPIKVP
jgi:hypothetical protein